MLTAAQAFITVRTHSEENAEHSERSFRLVHSYFHRNLFKMLALLHTINVLWGRLYFYFRF